MSTTGPTRTTTLIALAGPLLLALGACSDFYHREVHDDFTRTTFTEVIPDAVEEMLDACFDPLFLAGGDTEIDLLPTCSEDSGLGTEAELIRLTLEQRNPIPLSEPIPDVLFEFERDVWLGFLLFLGVPAPPACEVEVEYAARIGSLGLDDPTTEWTEWNGAPAFHLRFELRDRSPVVHMDLDLTADCGFLPVPPALQNALDDIATQGDQTIFLSASTLDVYVTFVLDSEANRVRAVTVIEVEVGELSSTLEGESDVEEALASVGLGKEDLAQRTAAVLRPLLEPIGAEMVGLIEDIVRDPGYRLCNIDLVAGELVIDGCYEAEIEARFVALTRSEAANNLALVTLEIRLANIGPADAGAFAVRWVGAGVHEEHHEVKGSVHPLKLHPVVRKESLNGLAAGEHLELSNSWLIRADTFDDYAGGGGCGYLAMTFAADSDDTVFELDEENNAAGKAWKGRECGWLDVALLLDPGLLLPLDLGRLDRSLLIETYQYIPDEFLDMLEGGLAPLEVRFSAGQVEALVHARSGGRTNRYR